ncbi:PQQ-binding-like beta-propeller repeat protein [Actinoplanes sp. NPDC024001]|uniref:outer membrane protein assembly factor BamB family protein n=1 Tax=Actinoplanes sp. NPDC024001 TaxID=3154598 RepID=UPI0033C1732C
MAYALADGARRWTRDIPGTLAGFQVGPDDGPLVVTVDPVTETEPDGIATGRTTVALQPATGKELWRRPGEVHASTVHAASALMVRYDGQGRISRLTRVRLTDGAPLWDRAGTAVQDIAVENDTGEPTRLVTNTATGELTVLRYADAEVVARRRLPGFVSEPAVGRYAVLQAENGRLTVLQQDGEESASTIYHLDTLREIPHSGSWAEVSYGCGVIVCGHTEDSMLARDPADGRVLWRLPGANGISVLLPDRLLIDVQGGGEHVLVESRTGRRLAEGLRGSVAPDYDQRQSVLLLNPAFSPPGRVSVTHLDMRTGEQTLLGSLESLPDQQRCQLTPGYLVCDGPSRFVVVAVPR